MTTGEGERSVPSALHACTCTPSPHGTRPEHRRRLPACPAARRGMGEGQSTDDGRRPALPRWRIGLSVCTTGLCTAGLRRLGALRTRRRRTHRCGLVRAACSLAAVRRLVAAPGPLRPDPLGRPAVVAGCSAAPRCGLARRAAGVRGLHALRTRWRQARRPWLMRAACSPTAARRLVAAPGWLRPDPLRRPAVAAGRSAAPPPGPPDGPTRTGAGDRRPTWTNVPDYSWTFVRGWGWLRVRELPNFPRPRARRLLHARVRACSRVGARCARLALSNTERHRLLSVDVRAMLALGVGAGLAPAPIFSEWLCNLRALRLGALRLDAARATAAWLRPPGGPFLGCTAVAWPHCKIAS